MAVDHRVIINYVKRDDARGTISSHFHLAAATFWYSALWLFVAFLCMITLVGIPSPWLSHRYGIWVVYRIIRGWMALSQRKAMTPRSVMKYSVAVRARRQTAEKRHRLTR